MTTEFDGVHAQGYLLYMHYVKYFSPLSKVGVKFLLFKDRNHNIQLLIN